MSCIQDDVKRGAESREKGNLDVALGVLQSALKLATYTDERAEIMGEIALCHQHLGNLDLATVIYKAALDDFCLISDVASVARMRRQLSSIEMLRGNVDEAYALAQKARNTVVDTGIRPVDLCHITHGIIKPLFVKRRNGGLKNWFKYSGEIFMWTWKEFTEVINMLKFEKSIARYVWLTGYLSDVARLLPPVTLPFGAIGYVIAKKNNLGIRLNQVKVGL
jgi:tetratricopeptide (TPR) repeat protein